MDILLKHYVYITPILKNDLFLSSYKYMQRGTRTERLDFE